MKSKQSITVGIPAYNEEQNIEAFLLSILAQKLQNTVLKHIVVYSDASTDKTHEIVEKLHKKYRLIELIKGKTRKGKYARMNEMFAACESDILLIMDADIAMVGERFIEMLTGKLQSDKRALTISASNKFARPDGFLANVLYTHFTMWDNILLRIPGFESASQFSGTATAFRGSYARKLRIPDRVSNPHLFLFLDAKSRKGFRFNPDARIIQYVPGTIDEVKAMLVRAIVQPDEELDRMFGKDFIKRYQYIPAKLKLQVLLKSFYQDPFYTPFAFGMTFYIGRLSKRVQKSKSQLWEIASTTKKPLAKRKKV